MKATSRNPVLYQAARFVKLAGIILVVLALLDYTMLLIPPNWGDAQWGLNFTTQMVDRGIVPVLGIALVYSGFGFEQLAGFSETRSQSASENLKFWINLTASVLALVFLLLIPLHMSNVAAVTSQTLERISQDATQAQEQLDQRLNQQQGQISSLIQDNQRLEDFISSDQATEQQLARLREYQGDPEALDQQVKEIRSSLTQNIEQRKLKAEKQSKQGAFKSNVRVCLSSALLAGCYITIGWSGFKGIKPYKKARQS